MEFFHDPATDRLAVIEFNPRLASQFGDLYRRVHGIDAHALGLALALGQDPASLPRREPRAAPPPASSTAASTPATRASPGRCSARGWHASSPTRCCSPTRRRPCAARDFKWLGSHRYGIVHLGGRDAADLRRRCEAASALLGWPAPYALTRRSPQAGGYGGGEPLRGPCPAAALTGRAPALAAGGGRARLAAACTLAPDADHDGDEAPRAAPLARLPTLAWVFCSGGPRGFTHVGVLRALHELGLVPDLIVGASVGALVGPARPRAWSPGDRDAGAGAAAADAGAHGLRRQRAAVRRAAGRADAAPRGGDAQLERMPLAMACVAARGAMAPRSPSPRATSGWPCRPAAIEGQFAPVRIRGETYVDADWHHRCRCAWRARWARARAGGRRHGARRPHTARRRALPQRRPEQEGARRCRCRSGRPVVKPDFGYWVNLSRDFRERAVAAGYRDTMARERELRALHRA